MNTKTETIRTTYGFTSTPKEAIRYIDNGFFHVSDKTAGTLARTTGNGKLPHRGYEKDVILSTGERATLQRTPSRYYTWSPKRGWVWAIYAIRPAAI